MASECKIPARGLIFMLLLCVVSALPSQKYFSGDNAVQAQQVPEARSSSESQLWDKMFGGCPDDDGFSCLKVKLLTNVGKLYKLKSFKLFEGVTLNQIPGTESQNSGRALSEAEIEARLPQDEDQREEKLDSLLGDAFSNLVSSRSLYISLDMILPGFGIKVARSESSSNAIEIGLDMPEEGRAIGTARIKGLKKILPYLLLFKMKAGMLGVLGLGALALLAGKALLISKLALLLSGIIGLKKLFSGGGSEYEVVSHPVYSHSSSYGGGGGGGGGSYGGGYGRSFNAEAPVSDSLAYRGHYEDAQAQKQ